MAPGPTQATLDAVARTVSPPVFLFDGDCSFCSSTARWLRRRLPTPTSIEPWQTTDLDPLRVTESEVDEAVVMVATDLTHTSGPAAFAALAQTSTSGAWRALGRVGALGPVLAVAGPVYRWIARNRHRLPGGTPQCSLPQAERTRST